MKNNSKLLSITTLFLIIILMISCKNSGVSTDYSRIRVKQVITTYDSYIDTMYYYYSGENVQTVNHYSYDPATKYTYNYTKNGSKYDFSSIYGTTPTHEGFLNLNAQGLIDTSRVTNIITTAFNNRNKSYYNSSGYQTRDISNYNTYENDIKKYYTAEGDFSYWIYDLTNFSVPANSYQDSVTFEYYSNELHVPYEFTLQAKYGKLNKHLVKKRYNYDKNTAVLKSTVEYQYELDSRGLVTKRTTKRYNQPGNVLTSTTIAEYTYEDF